MAYLEEKEWLCLSYTLYRLYQADSYEEVCSSVFSQLQRLVHFDAGLCFLLEDHNGEIVRTHSFRYPNEDLFPNHEKFMELDNIGSTNEMLSSPWSVSFRQSDVISQDKWVQSPIYQKYWKPANHFYGITLYLVYQNMPIATFTLFRRPDEEDFADRDLFIMDTVKEHLAQQLYRVTKTGIVNRKETQGHALPLDFSIAASEHGLTNREREITYLLCTGASREEICKQLFISDATLRKHIYNIYGKLEVKSQPQLILWFHKQTQRQ